MNWLLLIVIVLQFVAIIILATQVLSKANTIEILYGIIDNYNAALEAAKKDGEA